MLLMFFCARELFHFQGLEKATSVPGKTHRAQEAMRTSEAARFLES